MIKRKEVLIQAVECGFHETAEGAPLRLDECRGGEAEYEIWGNSGGVGDYDQTREKYVIPLTVTGKNLIDPDTLLTEQGFVKQSDGSFYVANNSVVYKKRLWENTEGYTGRMMVMYKFKYRYSNKENASCGLTIRTTYTDGTYTSVWLSSAKWDANVWIKPNAAYITSRADKTVDYIDWQYGTGANSTSVRDVVISKVTEDLPRTENIYLDALLGEGESISHAADNLPSLTLNNGTNTIIAETKIPPQKISVSYVSKVQA